MTIVNLSFFYLPIEAQTTNGIEIVEHPVLKNVWMIFHQNVLMILTHQSATHIRAVAMISSAIWTCLVFQPVLTLEVLPELNQAAQLARKDTQIDPRQITEAPRPEVTTVTQETVQASQDTWIHQPRVALLNVLMLQARVHGTPTQVHLIKLLA